MHIPMVFRVITVGEEGGGVLSPVTEPEPE
jgi:hypothetical protein